jgi:hypothetical protein
MKIPIYLVRQRTGQYREDGVEYVIVVDVKLTRLAAEQVAARYEGAEVIKLQADKETP